ncbi:MAG: type II toxin-antitoxin system RelE/ParE family toxin [Actinomycetia bacterium]|nr:type II toxin-antitoxin system RelE/ParE family toxin [Actinomycetes bacterium]
MTGRIYYTPEAEQQLDHLDDWIAHASSPQTAQRFICAILDHIEKLRTFPLAGRSRDDIRVGLRTSTFRKRTVIAYCVDGPADDPVITVIGVFHGGQDWEYALPEPQP